VRLPWLRGRGWLPAEGIAVLELGGQVVRDAERRPVAGDGGAGEPVDVAAGHLGWLHGIR
jgi:hypothetical protein